MSRKQILIGVLFGFSALFADEIRFQDGSLVKGTIRAVTESQIVIETRFAGTLQVDRGHVSGFSSDDPVFAQQDGTLVAASKPELAVPKKVEKKDPPPKKAATKKSPDVEKTAEPPRKWKFKVAGRLSGKSGNSDESALGMDMSAILVGKKDELKLYGSYNRKESNGRKSSDERQVGIRYTSYFNDPWGWYVRQEFSEDQFKNIELRSISAMGLSYRKMAGKKKTLGLNAGVSYRHEMYMDNTPDSGNLGLDLGLENFIGSNRRFELHNEFTLVPSLEETSSYLFTQNSYMDIPLSGSKRWKIRLGLRNDYNSKPTGNRKALDSSYYSSLVAEWD